MTKLAKRLFNGSS